jgi:hypothetical protein
MPASGELPRVIDGDPPLDLGGPGRGGLDFPDPPLGGGGFAVAEVDGGVTRLASALEDAWLSTGPEPAPLAGWAAPLAGPVPLAVVPVLGSPAPWVVLTAGPMAPAALPAVAPGVPGTVAPVVPGVVAGLAPVAPGVAPAVVLDPPAAAPVVPEAGVEPGLEVEESVVAGVAGVDAAPVSATAPWASPLEHMTANTAPSTTNVATRETRRWRRHGRCCPDDRQIASCADSNNAQTFVKAAQLNRASMCPEFVPNTLFAQRATFSRSGSAKSALSEPRLVSRRTRQPSRSGG